MYQLYIIPPLETKKIAFKRYVMAKTLSKPLTAMYQSYVSSVFLHSIGLIHLLQIERTLQMLHLHIKEYDTYTTGICRGLKIPDTEHKGAPVSIRKKDITYFTDFIVHIRNSRDLEVWETHDEILNQWEGKWNTL